MARTKKLSKDELLERKRARERERYNRIKSDPQRYELQQEKERKKYEYKKKKKLVKLVKDMTPREIRVARKTWREKKRNLKKRKESLGKALSETPPQSEDEMQDIQPDRNVQISSGKKRIRRDRSKIIKRNKQLLQTNANLKRQRDMYRKRYERALKKTNSGNVNHTPRTTVKKLMKSKNTKLISRKLIFGEVLQTQLQSNLNDIKKPQNKFAYVSSILGNRQVLRKYKLVKSVSSLLPSNSARYKTKSNNSLRKHKQRTIHNQIKHDVCCFLEQDENSRLAPGKRDTKTMKKEKRQKRYLNDTLQNLHKKFINDSPYNISYSHFCQFRPFWVVYQEPEGRDTCLCKVCVNTDYIVGALNRNKIIDCKNGKELSKELSCDDVGINCLLRKCDNCKDKVIHFQEFVGTMHVWYDAWGTQDVKYKDRHGAIKKSKHTVKLRCKISAYKLINSLEGTMEKYMAHQAIIRNQYCALSYLKLTMNADEALLHFDFSENYSLKYSSEVQSFHFGGSREQISLHTSSFMYKTDLYSEIKTKSFCTFSKNLKHDPPAILAHLEPVFSKIKEEKPNIRILHILSDGPSSQYRNQLMFYIFGNMITDYFPSLVYSTWNYYEAGHGKGAPDGEGGTVKRTADRLVGEGNDICTLEILINKLTGRLRNINMYVINEERISDITSQVDAIKSNTIPFKGTMKVHQVSVVHKKGEATILNMKTMSCFRCHREIEGKQGNSECTHNVLGQIKYPNSRNDYLQNPSSSEEISCEPVLYQFSPEPSCSQEQAETQQDTLENIKHGDAMLIKFKCKNKEYRYACLVLSAENNEIQVQGLRSSNKEKTQFVIKENDTFTISQDDIAERLPQPNILWKKRVITYDFPESLDVFEK